MQVARSLAMADQPLAEASGFRALDEGRWDRHRSVPTFVVTYEFVPPAAVTRTLRADASEAAEIVALDASTMARAGYLLETEQWRGTTFGVGPAVVLGPAMAYGWSGNGEISLSYRFDPETTGPPARAIVIEICDGSVGWWVLGVGRSHADHVSNARPWRSDRRQAAAAGTTLSDDEVQVRERMWAYLDDRHDHEMHASPTGRTAPAQALVEQRGPDPSAAHRSYQRPHLTDRAMSAIVPPRIDGQPPVDPARTMIVDVTIKGASATVSTLQGERDGLLPPARVEYRLELEGGHWLIAERRRFDVVQGAWLRESL